MAQVNFVKNHRVAEFIYSNGKINEVICKNEKRDLKRISADRFYLTAGAIESCRLLLEFSQKEEALKNTDLGKNYGDHVSMELFRVFGKPILDGTDFTFTFHKGSFVTKRIVVHSKNGLTGYLHFTFNDEVKVFSSIKKFLFGQQRSTFIIKEILQGLPFLIKSAYHYLILKRLYLAKDWSLFLDIEQPIPNDNAIHLLSEKDKFGERAVEIKWEISEEDRSSIEEIISEAQAILERSGLKFKPLFGKVSKDKLEDIYHPVGFVRMGSDERAPVSLNCQVKGPSNLFHFSTALFPSAKSINPTAAGFCLIEEHLNQ